MSDTVNIKLKGLHASASAASLGFVGKAIQDQAMDMEKNMSEMMANTGSRLCENGGLRHLGWKPEKTVMEVDSSAIDVVTLGGINIAGSIIRGLSIETIEGTAFQDASHKITLVLKGASSTFRTAIQDMFREMKSVPLKYEMRGGQIRILNEVFIHEHNDGYALSQREYTIKLMTTQDIVTVETQSKKPHIQPTRVIYDNEILDISMYKVTWVRDTLDRFKYIIRVECLDEKSMKVLQEQEKIYRMPWIEDPVVCIVYPKFELTFEATGFGRIGAYGVSHECKLIKEVKL